jgi:hypothetical protein
VGFTPVSLEFELKVVSHDVFPKISQRFTSTNVGVCIEGRCSSAMSIRTAKFHFNTWLEFELKVRQVKLYVASSCPLRRWWVSQKQLAAQVP